MSVNSHILLLFGNANRFLFSFSTGDKPENTLSAGTSAATITTTVTDSNGDTAESTKL